MLRFPSSVRAARDLRPSVYRFLMDNIKNTAQQILYKFSNTTLIDPKDALAAAAILDAAAKASTPVDQSDLITLTLRHARESR